MKTVEEFKAAMGHAPEQDDMDRVNCPYAGDIAHTACGWCTVHDKPMFACHYSCAKRVMAATGMK